MKEFIQIETISGKSTEEVDTKVNEAIRKHRVMAIKPMVSIGNFGNCVQKYYDYVVYYTERLEEGHKEVKKKGDEYDLGQMV